MRRRLWAIFIASLIGGLAHAADHFDGVKTGGSPSSDIADVYAFPAPSGEGVVLVLNSFPRAGAYAVFSDAIEYGFRLRPSFLETTEWGVATRVEAWELQVSCRFDLIDPSDAGGPMTAECRLLEDGIVVANTAIEVGETHGGPEPAMQIYAGLRADPFYTDAIRVRLARPRYRSLSSLISTGNSMRPARSAVGVNLGGPRSTRGDLPNVLSLVVELDIEALVPGFGPRFAVVGETRRRVEGP